MKNIMACCLFVALVMEFAVEVLAREPHDPFDTITPNHKKSFNMSSKSLNIFNASITGRGHCAKTPDCPVKQYCDYLQSCYPCSYLTEKCDAVDGDCCSASFIHNCPSNPLKSKCHPCEAALVAACQSTRTKAFECAQCSGVHQQTLKAAGCTNDDIAHWCAGVPVNPPHPPSSSWVEFDLSTKSWVVHGTQGITGTLGNGGYYWSSRNGGDQTTSESVVAFDAGNYSFEFEWATTGGFIQSCSAVSIEPLTHGTPTFGWTAVSTSHVATSPFHIKIYQTC